MIRAGRKFSVTVAYAAANRAYAVPVQAHPGTTLEEAIRRSGLLSLCPEIDLAANAVGVFGKRRPLSYLLSPDDRVDSVPLPKGEGSEERAPSSPSPSGRGLG